MQVSLLTLLTKCALLGRMGWTLYSWSEVPQGQTVPERFKDCWVPVLTASACTNQWFHSRCLACVTAGNGGKWSMLQRFQTIIVHKNTHPPFAYLWDFVSIPPTNRCDRLNNLVDGFCNINVLPAFLRLTVRGWWDCCKKRAFPDQTSTRNCSRPLERTFAARCVAQTRLWTTRDSWFGIPWSVHSRRRLVNWNRFLTASKWQQHNTTTLFNLKSRALACFWDQSGFTSRGTHRTIPLRIFCDGVGYTKNLWNLRIHTPLQPYLACDTYVHIWTHTRQHKTSHALCISRRVLAVAVRCYLRKDGFLVWTCGSIFDNNTDVCAILRYADKCDCGCGGSHSYDAIEEAVCVYVCMCINHTKPH